LFFNVEKDKRMYVKDIMTASPATIRHDETLADALRIMQQIDCRHLPVISREGHLIGIVSDRDCRLALNSPHILRERSQDTDVIQQTRVATIMSPAPIIVEGNFPAHEAARLMLENHISALPVMRGETLIGIITTSDIMMAFITSQRRKMLYRDNE
jgi:acetoin utilization protein AcuB